jgi:hypothetical protein
VKCDFLVLDIDLVAFKNHHDQSTALTWPDQVACMLPTQRLRGGI